MYYQCSDYQRVNINICYIIIFINHNHQLLKLKLKIDEKKKVLIVKILLKSTLCAYTYKKITQ